MTSFPAPGPNQDLSKLKPLVNSTGSHPVRGRGQWLFGAAAGYYNLMVRAAKADGVNLVGVSGHRTNAQQWELYRLWKAGRGNLAAYPGTSRHEFGQAVDVHTANCTDVKVTSWLKANAHRFRFKLTVKSECWHLQYMGDDMDAPVPTEIPMFDLPVAVPTIMIRDPRMKGPDITLAQKVLVSYGYDIGPVDGVWGPNCDKALRILQRELGIKVDGQWGAGTNFALEQDLSEKATPDPDEIEKLKAQLAATNETVLDYAARISAMTDAAATVRLSLEQAQADRAQALSDLEKASATLARVRAALG